MILPLMILNSHPLRSLRFLLLNPCSSVVAAPARSPWLKSVPYFFLLTCDPHFQLLNFKSQICNSFHDLAPHDLEFSSSSFPSFPSVKSVFISGGRSG